MSSYLSLDPRGGHGTALQRRDDKEGKEGHAD